MANAAPQLEPDGGLLPVSSETAVAPSIKRTWFLALVTGSLGKVTRRDGSTIDEASAEAAGEEEEEGSVGSSDVPGSGTVRPKEGVERNGRVAATTMAGGRRRKAVKAPRKK